MSFGLFYVRRQTFILVQNIEARPNNIDNDRCKYSNEKKKFMTTMCLQQKAAFLSCIILNNMSLIYVLLWQ
jgi:hypothetical protein